MTVTHSPGTLSPADLPLAVSLPRTSRFTGALRAFGRSVVRGLATDNGWFWAYGVWYPCLAPRAYDRR